MRAGVPGEASLNRLMTKERARRLWARHTAAGSATGWRRPALDERRALLGRTHHRQPCRALVAAQTALRVEKESEALPGRQADLHVDAPARVGV